MDYLKIAEVATQCEIKKMQIMEYYRFLGANSTLDDSSRNRVQESIDVLEKEKARLETKLRKLVN